MARKKSEFLSALGTMMEMWKVIVAAVFNLGGSDDDLRRILTDKSLAGKIAEVIMTNGKTVAKTLGDTYHVTVDYTRSLAEMIVAGRYDWANSDINGKNFPIERPELVAQTGKGPYRTPEPTTGSIVELVLIHLDRVVSTADVLRYFHENNLRPGDLPTLLALAESNPGLQQEFPIIALGSSWVNPHGNRNVPCLWDVDVGRELNLHRCGSEWDSYYRFLAVSK